MEKGLSAIKPEVLKAAPYTLRHFEAKIKINQNENPYEMPAPIKAAVEKTMARKLWSRYPAFFPEELAKRLAAFSGWKSEGVLVGNGSNELIRKFHKFARSSPPLHFKWVGSRSARYSLRS